MNQVKEMLMKLLNLLTSFAFSRKNIALRFVYAVMYVIICDLVLTALLFLVLFQFFWLFVAGRHSEDIKTLSHKLVNYAYRLMRYVTLNENSRPYPFGPFPEEMEAPEPTDLSVEAEKTAAAESPDAPPQTPDENAVPEAETEPAGKDADNVIILGDSEKGDS